MCVHLKIFTTVLYFSNIKDPTSPPMAIPGEQTEDIKVTYTYSVQFKVFIYLTFFLSKIS